MRGTSGTNATGIRQTKYFIHKQGTGNENPVPCLCIKYNAQMSKATRAEKCSVMLAFWTFQAVPWNALFTRGSGLAVGGLRFAESDRLATASLVARIAARKAAARLRFSYMMNIENQPISFTIFRPWPLQCLENQATTPTRCPGLRI